MEILPQQFRSPEIYGDFWFNSDPLPISALRGSTILVEFWDYSNQASLHTLPYTKEWHKRYAEMGLVVISVHTPEFPFGRDPINVRAAVEKLGVRHAVVMDNDHLVWGSFRNQVWPTKYLIDRNGFIRYLHSGEGSYQNFEHAIQSMLSETGYHLDFPLVMDPVREIDRPGALCYRATGEILTGWQRGTIGNVEGHSPESTIHYEDPGIYLPDRLYVGGNWFNDRNFLKLEETGGSEGHAVVAYQAKEVNAVIKPEGEKNFQVFVSQDGASLTVENRGDDIRLDDQGRSFLLVNEAKLFSLIKEPEFGPHTMRLSTRSNGFALYALSFVSGVVPEMVTRN
jgi:thiol-disulfide isomerase/thioredoxin